MVSFCVPALNEELRLEKTIRGIEEACRIVDVEYEVIIVNDGSTDGTGAVIKKLESQNSKINSITFEQNKGLGAGFRASLQKSKYPKILIVGGDNDLSRELIVKIIRNHDKSDMVFSYYLNKEVRGRRRNILSTLFATIYMVTFDIFVQYINGPCLYPVEKLRKIHLRSDRFSIASEASIKLLLSGCSFCEVGGLMQTGTDGSSSVSFKNLLEVIYSYLRMVWEIKFWEAKLYNKKPRRVLISID